VALQVQLAVKQLALIDAQLAWLHLQIPFHRQRLRQQQLLLAGGELLVLPFLFHIVAAGLLIGNDQYRTGQTLGAAAAGADLLQRLGAIGLTFVIQRQDRVQGQLQQQEQAEQDGELMADE